MGTRVSKSRVRQNTPTVNGGMSERASRRQSGERVPVEGDYLRLHRQSRQGYVILGEPGARRRQYVGPFWTDRTKTAVNPATIQEARRAILEHGLGATAAPEVLTVAELGRRFLAYVRKRYAARPRRIPHYEMSMRLLDGFAGTVPARDFGPLRLREFRKHIINLKRKDGETARYNRQSVNEHVQRVCLAFRHAVSLELVPESIHAALGTLDALVPGEDADLRESENVEAVLLEDVLRVLPFLSAELAAIVRLMLYTASRPDELLALRPMDILQSSGEWVALPVQHKNKHRGHTRKIPLSTAAMEVLAPFIKGKLPTAFLFSPAEAERRRHQRRTDARRTPEGYGHSPGDSDRTREGRETLRAPGSCYTPASFRRAVQRACEKAEEIVTRKADAKAEKAKECDKEEAREEAKAIKKAERERRFTPYQLRHAAATLVEAEMDELHAGAVLGDRDPRAAANYHKSKQRDIRAREASEVLAAKLKGALGEVG